MVKELGGAHWGLVPALLGVLWLIWCNSGGGGVEVWLVLWASLLASYDVASHRIPNQLTALTAIAGLAWVFLAEGISGLGWAALGGLTGFGLMAVFFFLGAVGGGDVKALGALSTFLDPKGALFLFVLTTLAGGLLSVARLLWARQGVWLVGGLSNLRTLGDGLTLPYGLAIWGGAIALAIIGGGP